MRSLHFAKTTLHFPKLQGETGSQQTASSATQSVSTSAPFASLGTIARIRHLTSCSHHDALEFPGGQIVLLTRLRPGQVAAVLQLPAVPAKHGHLEEESLADLIA